MSNNDPRHQTFCNYCGRECGTFEKLQKHLQEEHPDSLAQKVFAPIGE